MYKKAAAYTLILMALALPAQAASSRQDDIRRIDTAAQIFDEIMSTPDHAIPLELLQSAECIAIIPSEVKFAFVVGGNYGKGLVTCRNGRTWSGPFFLTVGGGSFGFQIGGSSTDFILVFRGRRGVTKLLSDKFKIGGDASAAAGPVGRSAAASTDIEMHAEILTYSRSRGVFAGVSLSGAVVQPDDSGNEAMYTRSASAEDILSGKVPPPKEAEKLQRAVNLATGTVASAPAQKPAK